MNKNSVLFGIVGIIIGLVIGFAGANYLNESAVQKTQIPQNPQVPQMPAQQMPAGQQTQGGQQTGMQPDVQKVLDKAKNEPENYDAQLNAARMYSQIQRFTEALEFYQKAQQIKPNEFESNALLGNAFDHLSTFLSEL